MATAGSARVVDAWGRGGAGAQATNVDQIEANLKRQSHLVEQVAQQLATPSADEATLGAAVQTLLAAQVHLENDHEALTQALDEPNQRLRQLGPAPGKRAPPESPDIARLRDELANEVSRLEGLKTTAELTNGAVGDLLDQIREQKRALFLSDLGTRNSPFSPGLWTQAVEQSGALLEETANRWRERGPSDNRAADLALLRHPEVNYDARRGLPFSSECTIFGRRPVVRPASDSVF